MPIVTSQEAFQWATSRQRALVAFNVITLEHAEAVIWEAENQGVPVIVQLSHNAIDFHKDPAPIARGVVELASQSSQPVVPHLDHIEHLDLAKRTADLGFTSLMWDSSKESYAANVRHTSEVADWAHSHGLWIESELGEIGGKDGAHAPGVKTDPGEAARFARDTGIDALAVAVGSSHAMVDQSADLDLSLIEDIASICPVPLVLHGSTGVPPERLEDAIGSGMRKINIGTALSIAYTSAVRKKLAADERLVDPRKFLRDAREQVQAVVARYLKLLTV